ncbi:MAG: CoA transferase [Turneriella sp.]|nr:CoA transferase [Leptospiraceae bacterium]MCX7632679.1 CoA transferase [Turneriella sp.]
MPLTEGPLAGVRVLDLSMLLPGPLCSQHLADLGAEVIKVENPRTGDLTRHLGNKVRRNGHAESGAFLQLNRNKKSITVNIKREGGRQVLLRLLENCDILLEGFRPDTLHELGIGYEQLKDKFPRLIYCAISGYGATGLYKDHAGHDANYIARAGLLALNGSKGGPPVIPGFQVADIAGGTLTALAAILAALYAREKTGRGQFIDISMQDGSLQFLSLSLGDFIATGEEPVRGNTLLSGKLPNYRVYETKDGKYVVLAALEEKFFHNFLRQIGREDIVQNLARDDAGFAAASAELEEIFKSRTHAEWAELFNNPDICFSEIKSFAEVLSDPHLRARGMVREIEHPKLGKIPVLGSPFHLSETPATYRLPPPEMGQHTEEILYAAGFSSEEIEKLRKERCI